MTYNFRGSLHGHLCDNYPEPITGATVLLYAAGTPAADTAPQTGTVARDAFRLVTEDEARRKADRLIGKGQVDDKGNFEVAVAEQYANTAFDIDFECGTVPGKIPVPRKTPLQFHLTTVQPQWQTNRQERDAFYEWNYAIPAKWWCNIRGHYFDAWVILGHMYICGTKTPIPGVQITAMDADLFTDDNLGTAVTNTAGFFRIDYSSADFKKTFLSPFINVETDPGPSLSFVSGPDVYFKYQYNGVAIQSETKTNRRNNVGHCLCVSLCLKDIVVTPTGIPASFTSIGNHFINEIVAGASTAVIAAATGKTVSDQAFYSYIKLKGSLTQKLNNVQLEYAFDTVETTGPGGANIGSWKRVKAAQLADISIGVFFNFTGNLANPISIDPYLVGPSGGMDANGWIKVPDGDNFAPNVNSDLLYFNTASLNEAAVDMAGLVQGQSVVTKAPLQPNRFFKIRMIKREIGNAASEVPAGESNAVAMFNTTYKKVPKYGSWMPQTADEIGVACLNVQEMIGGGGGTGCTPITTALHINYTAANPNMGAVGLDLKGPGGPYTIENVTPTSNVAETHGTAEELHNPALVLVKDLKNCAYTATLSVEIKLTDGETQHPGLTDWLSFCKSEIK